MTDGDGGVRDGEGGAASATNADGRPCPNNFMDFAEKWRIL